MDIKEIEIVSNTEQSKYTKQIHIIHTCINKYIIMRINSISIKRIKNGQENVMHSFDGFLLIQV